MKVWWLAVVAACGFDHGALPGPPGNSDDAASGNSDAIDAANLAGDAPPDTIGMGPWTNITAVLPGSPTGDDDPTLTADLLELYFNRAGDIYVTTRTAIGQAWTTPARVDELSSTSNETTPEITGDGLYMQIGSDRTGTDGQDDVWVSTRASRSFPWSTPAHVAELSSITENAASAPTDDRLVVVQIGSPQGDVDMFQASRTTANGTFSTPMPLTTANSTSSDFSPMLSQDRLTLYFDSTRSDNEDLWVATRTTATGSFATPTMISELSTSSTEETDPWVSPDGHHIFFVRNTVLFEASR